MMGYTERPDTPLDEMVTKVEHLADFARRLAEETDMNEWGVSWRTDRDQLRECATALIALLAHAMANESDKARLDWMEAVRPRVGIGEDRETRLLSRDGHGALLASKPTLRDAIDVASTEADQ